MSAPRPDPGQPAPEQQLAVFVPGWLVHGQVGTRMVIALGTRDLPDFDPFLPSAGFGGEEQESYAGCFPNHPDRGVETVPYVIEDHFRYVDGCGNTAPSALVGCSAWRQRAVLAILKN